MVSLSSRPIPNLQDVDLRLLRVFVSVARNRGFSAAQTELNIGQSTISGYISSLEDRLGVKLCKRGRGGFNLTDSGEQLYDAALELFDDLDRFRLKVGEVRDDLTGNYAIGTVDSVVSLGQSVLPRILGSFAKDAPNLMLELRLASPQALVRDLNSKRFNAIVLPVFRPLVQAKVVSLDESNPQILFCARNHPLYGKEPDLEQIKAMPFADRAHMEGWSPYTCRGLNVAATTVDVECQLLLILSGQFIGYLPNYHAQDLVESGELWSLSHPEFDYDSRVCLAVRSDDESEATRFLVHAAEAVTGRELASEA
jgi:DNA-binding transcriptional LysR family regulator